MKIGREYRRSREKTFVLLALALAVELLEPLVHHRVGRLIADHHFNLFAAPVKEISRCGIFIAIVLIKVGITKLVHSRCRTLHNRVDINSGNRNRKKSDRRKNGIASSDVIGYYEGFIALLIGKCLESAPRPVGSCVDAFCRLVPAVLAFEHFSENSESDSRLGRCARLGNYIDRKIPVSDYFYKLVNRIRADRVACEIYLRCAVPEQIVVLRLDKFNRRSCSEIRTADSDNNQNL